jgi:hypothetical protein
VNCELSQGKGKVKGDRARRAYIEQGSGVKSVVGMFGVRPSMPRMPAGDGDGVRWLRLRLQGLAQAAFSSRNQKF